MPDPTYFQIFSQEPLFAIDLRALEQTYFILQRQHHPDRFAARPPAERQQAMQQSMLINDAYYTLKSPLKRAQYMLHLHGIKVGGERDTVKPNACLLMDVMAQREALSESDTVQTLETLAKETDQAYQECINQLQAAFSSGQLDDAAQSTLRLGYLIRMQEETARKKSTITRHAPAANS